MKTHCLFLVLLGGLLAGCRSPNEEYGNFGILMFGVASCAVTGYDTVKTGLMKHVQAAPGTTLSDFEAAIEQTEKISSVPAGLGPSPNFTTDHSSLFKYEGRKAVYYGRFVQGTNQQSESDLAFSMGELTNLAAFVARLKTPADPVSAYLISRFAESNRLVVAGFPESGLDEKTLEVRLVNELNGIVLGPPIYKTDRFQEVTLRPGILLLIRRHYLLPPETGTSREEVLALVNRMLLADAYPANLPMKRWNPLRNYVAVKY
jgi:hypothetical protein